jgi:hypothetical protein
VNEKAVHPPPIGSEWYEDDPRIYPTKITVVAHWGDGKVRISRHPEGKHPTTASVERFGKRGGYKAWLLRAQHPKASV